MENNFDVFFENTIIGTAKNIKLYEAFGFIGLMELDKYYEFFSVSGKIVSIKSANIKEEYNNKIILRGCEVFVWKDDHINK